MILGDRINIFLGWFLEIKKMIVYIEWDRNDRICMVDRYKRIKRF